MPEGLFKQIKVVEAEIAVLYEEAEQQRAPRLPPGLAIKLDHLEDLRSQIGRTPIRNAADAVSVLQLVEGLMDEGDAPMVQRVVEYLSINVLENETLSA